MIILVTGTPGTGKSTLAMEISKELSLKLVSVSSLVIERKLYFDYDQLRKSYVMDEERLVKVLKEEVRDGAVVETIYPSVVENPDKVILLRKDPRVLYQELMKRGWSELKSAENAMAEAIGYVASEAWETFKNVCEIDVTNRSVEETKRISMNCEESRKVDWLTEKGIEEFLTFLDNVITRNVEH
ncbi:adenylate kinase family protein [Sulfuracidifex tepidarius]|uniref:Putative adenylate kinase n=1 Tax=Sulfuracidifex tepidarius TaxID=1294262 RepID=A0A510DVV4_9CREN|nr:adenylate kinase family protein [Sulfuracidifex tepidarius]BBG24325.1 Putative adenylate kinase [Sulfuracidifex tepidarius]BBG27082.1 Putative adenylate kinase [Sulfuracidifex tepidarius]